ncbi:MAG: hypothetical protein ACRERX_02215 [Pseudomonas sp.]
MTIKNGASAPIGSGLPKESQTPLQVLNRSLKEIDAAGELDDLILAAYIASGRADALALTGLIDRQEYRRYSQEIINRTQAVRLLLEAGDDQSH